MEAREEDEEVTRLKTEVEDERSVCARNMDMKLGPGSMKRKV